jgi:cell division protein FtsB
MAHKASIEPSFTKLRRFPYVLLSTFLGTLIAVFVYLLYRTDQDWQRLTAYEFLLDARTHLESLSRHYLALASESLREPWEEAQKKLDLLQAQVKPMGGVLIVLDDAGKLAYPAEPLIGYAIPEKPRVQRWLSLAVFQSQREFVLDNFARYVLALDPLPQVGFYLHSLKYTAGCLWTLPTTDARLAHIRREGMQNFQWRLLLGAIPCTLLFIATLYFLGRWRTSLSHVVERYKHEHTELAQLRRRETELEQRIETLAQERFALLDRLGNLQSAPLYAERAKRSAEMQEGEECASLHALRLAPERAQGFFERALTPHVVEALQHLDKGDADSAQSVILAFAKDYGIAPQEVVARCCTPLSLALLRDRLTAYGEGCGKRVLWEPMPTGGHVHALVEGLVRDLLHNAWEAGQNNVRVYSEVSKDSAMVEIRVCDAAQGIPESVRPFAGKPFCSTKLDHYGLGLFRVNAVAKSLGGSCTLHSEVGKGTVVVLNVPLVPTQDQDK